MGVEHGGQRLTGRGWVVSLGNTGDLTICKSMAVTTIQLRYATVMTMRASSSRGVGLTTLTTVFSLHSCVKQLMRVRFQKRPHTRGMHDGKARSDLRGVCDVRVPGTIRAPSMVEGGTSKI